MLLPNVPPTWNSSPQAQAVHVVSMKTGVISQPTAPGLGGCGLYHAIHKNCCYACWSTKVWETKQARVIIISAHEIIFFYGQPIIISSNQFSLIL